MMMGMGEKTRVHGGNRRGVLAGALMIMVALATTLVTSPAWAEQGTTAPAVAQLNSERNFDIPAQPLTDALVAFGQQSGIQVTVNGTVARNVSAPAVQGTMTSEQALRRLLAGSGLIYTLSGSTVAIERSVQGTDGAIMLDSITIEGRAGSPPQAEIGNLPPEYAGGQLARGGKLGMLGNRDFMDTPFNQTSFTSELMKNQQAKMIGDVLESDPSVYITYPESSGVGNYAIRGFTLSGSRDFSQDGLYGLFQGANVHIEQFERVEVLKGPSALVNGISPFGSIGGTVNLVPKRAGNETLIQFTPQYYSEQQAGGHVDTGLRFGADKQFGVRFNGVYRNGDTSIDRQSQKQQLAAVGLDYRGESLRLTGDFAYSGLDVDVARRPISGVAAGVPVPDTPDSSDNWKQPWTYSEQQTWNGALRGELDLTDNWTAHIAGGSSLYHISQETYDAIIQDTQGTLSGTNAFALNLYYAASTIEGGINGHVETGPIDHELALSATRLWFEQGFAFSSAALAASNLYNPVFYSRPDFGDIPEPGDAPKTGEKDNTGLALADTLSILDDQVQLTLGARWQRVTTTSFNSSTGAVTGEYDEEAITPAIGLVVKPLQSVSLYMNYIEGLQEGSTAPASADNAGEIFPPTVTVQYEAGVKLDTGNLGLTISAFQLSQPSSFTDPSTRIFSENGEERHRGLEFTAFGKLVDDVRILGGVTYMDAELTKTEGGVNQGNRPQGVPEFRANLRSEWDTPFLRGLTLSGTATYASSTFIDQANLQENDGWIRFDAGLRYTIERSGGEPIVIRADVRNLTDAAYWLVQSGSLGLSEPRTFVLSTTFNF